MPRNISFAMTKEQVRARTKTQTRRWGWLNLKPETELNGVEQAMGLKKGQKIVSLCQIRTTAVRREPLNAITQEDVIAEGFPDWTRTQFVDFLLSKSPKKTADDLITVISFEYI